MSAEVTHLNQHAATVTATAFQPLGLPGEGPGAETAPPVSASVQPEPPAPARGHTVRNLVWLGVGAGVLAGAYWAPGYFLKPQQPAQRPLAFTPRVATPPGGRGEAAPQAGLRLPGSTEAPAGDAGLRLGRGEPTPDTPQARPTPADPAAPPPNAPMLTFALPAAPAPAPPAPAATGPDPADPAAQATRLVAGPMSTQEQVDVLGLVTAMGAKMLQIEEDNAALRDQVKAATGSSGDRWADLERRLSLLEARRALDALQGRGMAAAPTGADPMTASRPMRGPAAAEVPAPAPVPAQSAAQAAWRVQGGSPHMAVIAQPGGPVKAVSVGQVIDEQFGRVQRIYQQGREWVVQAERGAIRGGG